MADQTFIYSGPPSGATLKLADGEQREVLFHPGRETDLPADHPHVQRLVARQLLHPVPEERPRRSSSSARALPEPQPAEAGESSASSKSTSAKKESR